MPNALVFLCTPYPILVVILIHLRANTHTQTYTLTYSQHIVSVCLCCLRVCLKSHLVHGTRHPVSNTESCWWYSCPRSVLQHTVSQDELNRWRKKYHRLWSRIFCLAHNGSWVRNRGLFRCAKKGKRLQKKTRCRRTVPSRNPLLHGEPAVLSCLLSCLLFCSGRDRQVLKILTCVYSGVWMASDEDHLRAWASSQSLGCSCHRGSHFA